MNNLYFSKELNESTHLYLAPLSQRRQAWCTEDVYDTSGYFLFEECKEDMQVEITILAQVHSDDAAIKLSKMFDMD